MVRTQTFKKLRETSLLAVAFVAAFAMLTAFSTFESQAHDGPDSVADLAESVLDAVVNISIVTNSNRTTQPRRNRRPNNAPRSPENSPFEEFFDDFFKKQQSPPSPRRRNPQSLGSGFVIDPTGYIVTNNHVIEGANVITINFHNGSKLEAKLVGTDAKTDIALLKVESKKPLPFVNFGSSNDMRVGNWVMVIGNPFGLTSSVSIGIISALNRDIQSGPYDNYIQTDAAINQGNSGGPLFNKEGDVVGVNTAIFSPSGGGSVGVGFSVPSDTAKLVVSQLREFGETRRGWLGVRIDQVTEELAERFKLGKPRGALVAGVTKTGPAEKSGILSGDIIVTFDGKNVKQMRDLPRMVADTPIGKDVDVIVIRDGKEVPLKVKLGRLEEGEKIVQNETQGNNNKPEETKPEPTPNTPDAKPSLSLGLTLSELTGALRDKYKLAESVKGVVITNVAKSSKADEKKIKEGDVIVEVGQTEISKVEDVENRLAELQKANRRSALFLISSESGELRFVALRLGS